MEKNPPATLFQIFATSYNKCDMLMIRDPIILMTATEDLSVSIIILMHFFTIFILMELELK